MCRVSSSEGGLGRPLCSVEFPPLIQDAGLQDVGMARMLTKNVLTSLHGTFGEGTLLYGLAVKLCEHAVCDIDLGNGFLGSSCKEVSPQELLHSEEALAYQ